ncbi:MAG TPA: ArgR family transcriptional regulator [Candidatus Angelobacter sp.]|nr:ArgR family transcriptional regulator [Candidatus Angelobacter sp.]
MTKLARQQLIVELAHQGPLPNQQELVKVLARRGFPVTQATLSRDINELQLVRTSEGYTLSNGDSPTEPAPGVSRLVREFVREVRRAQNLLVIKTTSGSAQPVALAVDGQGWDEVVGTVAGDDTILVITPDNKTARKLQTRLEDMRA